MKNNQFTVRLKSLYDLLMLLEQQVKKLPSSQLLTESIEELQVAIEEMSTAHEYLVTLCEALEAENRSYHELFDSTPDGYLITDKYGIIREANRAAGCLLNNDPQYLLGKPLAVFVVDRERQVFYTQLAQLSQANGIQEWEMQLHSPSQVPFYAALRVNTVRNHTGQIVALHWLLRDVSRRKHAEELLYQRQQEFETLVENSPDIIARMDRNLRYVFINRTIERATGCSPQEIIGNTNQDLGTATEKIEEWNERNRRILATGEPDSSEFDFRSPEGIRHYQSCYIPEFAQDGSVASIMIITRDVTEYKQAQQKIQESLQEKELLLQEIHHRVKNNLQIISSLLRLQARQTEDLQAREIFQDSQNRISSMALVHESLYSSQHFSQINFAQYIRVLAANLLKVYKIQPEAISLRVNANPEIAVSLVQAIPCGLILNELITNALKHGFSDGSIKGEVFISSKANPEGQLTLIVRNNGNPFPTDFDIHTTQSMGLKLVVTLVKQLKGRIEIDGSNGNTVKIVFTLM